MQRIFIVDDCEILAMSLSIVIDREAELTVIGTSGSSGDICDDVIRSGCEILLISLRLRNACGLEIVRKLRAAGSTACIIILGYSTDVTNVQQMYHAGADAFISISCNNEEIIARILLARRNQNVCDFSITASSDRLTLMP